MSFLGVVVVCFVAVVFFAGNQKGHQEGGQPCGTHFPEVWNPKDGSMLNELKGHGHWINTLALNLDYVIRSGPFSHEPQKLLRARMRQFLFFLSSHGV